MIKVSIIIPVYNENECIKKYLNKFIISNVEDIELICIDYISCKSDMLNYFMRKSKNIKILKSKNQNLMSGIYEAINISLGKYVQILNSKDYIEFNTIEYFYNKSLEENIDIILINSKDKITTTYKDNHNINEIYEVNTGIDKIKSHHKNNWLDISSIFNFYNKSIMDKINKVYNQYICDEESLLISSIFESKKIAYVDMENYNYKKLNEIKHINKDIETIKYLHKLCEEFEYSGEKQLYIYEYIKYIMKKIIYSNEVINNIDKLKTVIKELKFIQNIEIEMNIMINCSKLMYLKEFENINVFRNQYNNVYKLKNILNEVNKNRNCIENEKKQLNKFIKMNKRYLKFESYDKLRSILEKTKIDRKELEFELSCLIDDIYIENNEHLKKYNYVENKINEILKNI